jgi:type II secretory pathway component GspD/PulD (secretin)
MLAALLGAVGAKRATAAAQVPPLRVSLEASNEAVQSVLLRLAHRTHTSIAVGSGVTGYVTVSLHEVTLAYALDAVLAPLGDTYHLHGGVYDIEPLPSANSVAALALGSRAAPVVLPLTIVPAKRAAAQLHALFPQAAIRPDEHANALIVIAPPGDVQAMRAVLQGLDVRDPMAPSTAAISLRFLHAADVVARLQAGFPNASFIAVGRTRVLVTASPQDVIQIRTALGALDVPEASPPPLPADTEAVRVTQRAPREVARALEGQIPGLRAAVSGGTVVLSGPPELVQRAKTLVAQIDVPPFDVRYTQVYRIRSLDAGSVADLLRRSFTGIDVTVDPSVNAIAVTATPAQQQRIADALSQLDPAPGSAFGLQGTASFAGSSTDVVTLKSYVPGTTTGGGTDAVQTIIQALQTIAPDVKVITLPTPGQIALIGSTSSLRIAHDFIDKVDVVAPLVVLDTEILELDESVTKNLGFELGSTSISTTYTEQTPAPNASGIIPKLGNLGAFGRTPISFQATINLALQAGKGRVLADPRITTLSGHTASIRAGDTISILTTTAGNAGTIATTQVQSFQTGVTLDITPSVTPDGGVTVSLHPVVNSLAGTNNGVPEISTRDTQTTVHLRDNQTLVIGGLIQINDTRTTTKVPILGDLPLVGKLFTNENVDNESNELVIVVTPHIIRDESDRTSPGPGLPELPQASPLPTLPPNAHLPPPSGQLPLGTARGGRELATAQPISLGSPTPIQSIAPVGVAAGPSPSASVSPQANVFTYGSVPPSNLAKPADPVQILYATLSPTSVSNGTSIHVTATTTTNASAVKIVLGTVTISLGQTGIGQWQGTFPFPSSAVAPGGTVSLSLVASRNDGASTAIPITVTVSSP